MGILIKQTIAIIIVLFIAVLMYKPSGYSQKEYRGLITKPKISSKDLKCLAENVYREARGETVKGMELVALVTLNRAKAKSTSVCRIVYAPYQFSWTLEKGLNKISQKEFKNIKAIVSNVVKHHDSYSPKLKSIKYYYNPFKINKPNWAYKMKVKAIEGNHIFLAEK